MHPAVDSACVRSHLVELLSPGDEVLGYDLEAMSHLMSHGANAVIDELPPLLLVMKKETRPPRLRKARSHRRRRNGDGGDGCSSTTSTSYQAVTRALVHPYTSTGPSYTRPRTPTHEYWAVIHAYTSRAPHDHARPLTLILLSHVCTPTARAPQDLDGLIDDEDDDDDGQWGVEEMARLNGFLSKLTATGDDDHAADGGERPSGERLSGERLSGELSSGGERASGESEPVDLA